MKGISLFHVHNAQMVRHRSPSPLHDCKTRLHKELEIPDADVDRVSGLLEFVHAKDENGKTPLHYACGATEDGGVAKMAVVAALIAAGPQERDDVDDEGKTPLHYACSAGAGVDVVNALLNGSPNRAKKKDRYGKTPLHCIGRDTDLDVVSALLQAAPNTAHKNDDRNRVPLHYACELRASRMIVRALLAAAPVAVLKMDSRQKTPIDIEKRREVITLLRGVA